MSDNVDPREPLADRLKALVDYLEAEIAYHHAKRREVERRILGEPLPHQEASET